MADEIRFRYSVSGVAPAPPGAYRRIVREVMLEAARRTVEHLRRSWPRASGLSASTFSYALVNESDDNVTVRILNPTPYTTDVRLKDERGPHAAIVEPLFERYLEEVIAEQQPRLAEAAEADALRSLRR